jgi:geranylgeranylglycerol-phosphate geranylgeranyltransferase
MNGRKTTGNKIVWWGLLRLFRIKLPFAAGVCVVLGELLALGQLPTAVEVVLGLKSVINYVAFYVYL